IRRPIFAVWILCVSAGILLAVWWWITRDERRAHAAAEVGLTVLVERVTPENYRAYGLNSYNEASRLTLGKPIAVSYVSDDELTDFSSEMKLQKLIRLSQTRMYPVVADGQGRVVIRVSKYDTGWEFDSVGEKD